MSDYDPVVTNSAVQAVVSDVMEQGVDLAKLMGLSAFYIADEDASPRAFVRDILRAGRKMGFAGDQCYQAQVHDGTLTFYFVGREVDLVRQIRELLDSE